MTRKELAGLLENGALLLDGATGSNLRAAGMPVGVCAEAWILEHRDVMIGLQRAYIEAGSRVILAPTFGGNRVNLRMYGLEARFDALNHELVALSKEASGGRAFVAGDMTTLGKPVDAPDGLSYDALLEVYREQAAALLDAGVDLFAIETMMGVNECCAAVEAVRSLCDLPVFCTLSLDGVGGAYFDGDAVSAAETLPALGVDAVGINCGQGPSLYANIVRDMVERAGVPVIAKPNAGLPTMTADGRAVYSLSPNRFAREMLDLYRAGATILGGCCGTTPDHIRALRARLDALV